MGDYRLISTTSLHTASQSDLVSCSSVFNFDFLLVYYFQDQSHCTFACDDVQACHSLCCCQVSAMTLIELFGQPAGLDHTHRWYILDI